MATGIKNIKPFWNKCHSFYTQHVPHLLLDTVGRTAPRSPRRGAGEPWNERKAPRHLRERWLVS